MGKGRCVFLFSCFSKNTEENSVQIKFKSHFSYNPDLLETPVMFSSPFVHEKAIAGLFQTICAFSCGNTSRFPSQGKLGAGLGAAQRDPGPKATVTQVSGSTKELSYIYPWDFPISGNRHDFLHWWNPKWWHRVLLGDWVCSRKRWFIHL